MTRTIAVAAALAAILMAGCRPIAGVKQRLGWPKPVNPAALTVVGFNVESGDAAPAYLAREQFAPAEGVDLWGLSEVRPGWLEVLQLGAAAGEGTDYSAVLGTTGGDDRLAILYNPARLTLVVTDELQGASFEGVRAPLIAQFQRQGSSQQFLFMVNHLYRSNEQKRHQQAELIN